MHALKPNTNYRIINVEIVFSEDTPESEITDGMNEMLNRMVAEPEPVIADWRYGESKAAGRTGDEVCEGEMFH